MMSLYPMAVFLAYGQLLSQKVNVFGLMKVLKQSSTRVALNKQLKPTSTALLVLCFSATLAQNNQLRSGGLAGR